MSQGEESPLQRVRQHLSLHEAQRGMPSQDARFRPLRSLGRGGMGEVVLAWDAVLKREVALKELHDRAPVQRQRQRFETEARALAALRHPHIVRVHELIRDEGDRLYLVLDYVAGESLEERLGREGPLPPGEAVRIALALAEALEHAHERGVLHRDVKPGNVLLTPEGGVFLADFGLAKLRDHSLALTRSGQLVGTPDYMAPEQILDAKRADARSDLYALGATLYAMLTGAPPFQAPSLQELVAQVLDLPAPDLRSRRPDAPRSLARVCARCLAKAPEQRYPHAGALAADLRALHEGRQLRPAVPRVGWAALLAAAALGGGLATLWREPAGAPSQVGATLADAPPPAVTTTAPSPSPDREQPPPVDLSGLVVPVAGEARGVAFADARSDRLLISDASGVRLWALEPAGARELWSVPQVPPGALVSAPEGQGAVCLGRGAVSFLGDDGALLGQREPGSVSTAATFVPPGTWLVAGTRPSRLTRYALEDGLRRGAQLPQPVRVDALAWDARDGSLGLAIGDASVPGPRQLEVGTLDPWTRRAAWLLSADPSVLLPGRRAGEWIVGLESGSLLCLSVENASRPPDFAAQAEHLVSPPETLSASLAEFAGYAAHVGQLVALSLTPSGALLSVSAPSQRLHDPGDVRVWDLERGQLVGVALRLEPSSDPKLRAVAFSRDGRYLALPAPHGLRIYATADLLTRAGGPR